MAGMLASLSKLRDRQRTADLPGKPLRNLRVTRNSFHMASSRVGPKRVRPAFAFQVTAVVAQVSK